MRAWMGRDLDIWKNKDLGDGVVRMPHRACDCARVVARPLRGGAFLALLLGGSTVAAQDFVSPTARCVFTVECYEAETCGDSRFTMDLFDPAAPGGARLLTTLVAETEFGTLEGYTLKRAPRAVSHVFEAPGALYLLSVAADGARLSVHMNGPQVVTYLGQCEDPA